MLELAERLSGATPTPAAGTAVAGVVEIAMALVAKVAARSAADWPEAGGVAAQVDAMVLRVTARAEGVELSYATALEAIEQGGDESIERALAAAVDAALAEEEACAAATELAAATAGRCNPAHRADAVAAALLCEAATRACAHLVAVNLTTTAQSDALGRSSLLVDQATAAARRASR